jgi:tetratricopeptide (TPR) repeat protein
VADDSWFRNPTWNTEIAARFEEKLRRARRKEQYLRIQANYLTRSQPDVALMLLDRFFKLPDQWDQAQAHVDRADALVTLGRIEEAIASYEAALAREAGFPNLRTSAYLRLPTLIVERALAHHYDKAMAVLVVHAHEPLFPSHRFQWHSAYALILASRNRDAEAREHARLALDAASQQHSGFAYHPKVGLVDQRHQAMLKNLSRLCDA